jgi:thiamine kinase
MSSELEALDALALIPDWDSGTTTLEQFKGGLTNRTFLIRRGAERCVLRLNADSTEAVASDRSCELAVLRSAAQAGLAPDIVFSDIERGILVTEYLPDPVWSSSDLQDRDNLLAIADLLRKVHALPECGMRLDLNLSAARYEEFLERRHGLHAHASRCVEVIAAIPVSEQLVCCHNDIVADNIISSAPLKLIDWEYACDNDPLFDLASLIGFHNLDKKLSHTLLDAYCGGANAEMRERLANQLRVFDAIQWLWLASRHLSNPQQQNVGRLEELQQRIG